MEPTKKRNSSLKKSKRGSKFAFKIDPKKINVRKSIFNINKGLKSRENNLMASGDSMDLKLNINSSNENSVASVNSRRAPEKKPRKSRMSIIGQTELIKNEIRDESKRRTS